MIKIYGLLAIMVLLRLVPRDCWLVVVLAQNERYHGRSLFDARWASEAAFFERSARAFLAKRSSNVGFGENCLYLFLHEYIKLGL
jgi:hypothetical protein